MEISSVEEALAEIKAGRLVIVADDTGREDEGDLICAAEYATPANVNFMSRFGRGLICVAMAESRFKDLGIRRLAPATGLAATPFMEPVDASSGVTTGVSAYDRSRTIRLLAAAESQAADFVRPGHVFTLAARSGGVIERQGHTEAAYDLAWLAGLSPVGVTCEILKDDGTMARLADLQSMAKLHDLKLVTISELVAFRKKMPRE